MNSLGSGYRVFTSYWFKHWLSPSTYWNWVKWKIQRANRGWADCDTWSLDGYLSDWLPDALRYLKEHKRGIPSEMFSVEDCNEDGNPSKEGMKRAKERWNGKLDDMIAGFEVWHEFCECAYPENLSAAELTKRMAQDQEIFEKAGKLFIEHFGSLWD